METITLSQLLEAVDGQILGGFDRPDTHRYKVQLENTIRCDNSRRTWRYSSGDISR